MPRPRPGAPSVLRRAHRTLREHRAARAVEVAGEDVDHVDQPARRGAELLRAGADAGVDGGRLRRRELAREPADGRRVDAAGRRDALRREGARQLGDARRCRCCAPSSAPGRVSCSSNSVCTIANSSSASVPGRMKWCSSASSAVRVRRGSSTTHRAAARAQRADATLHVGRGHQAAVRDQRVRAEDQQVVGAVDVGDRHGQRRAEHQPGRDLLRHLVDGARRVDVVAAERAQQAARVQTEPEVVRRRIAEVDRDRVAAVRGEDRRQARVDLAKGLLPARLAPLAAAPDHRRAQAVGVGVELGDRGALGADEAVAERVGVVAAHRDHLATARGDLEVAVRLAQRAGVMVRRRFLLHGVLLCAARHVVGERAQPAARPAAARATILRARLMCGASTIAPL